MAPLFKSTSYLYRIISQHYGSWFIVIGIDWFSLSLSLLFSLSFSSHLFCFLRAQHLETQDGHQMTIPNPSVPMNGIFINILTPHCLTGYRKQNLTAIFRSKCKIQQIDGVSAFELITWTAVALGTVMISFVRVDLVFGNVSISIVDVLR